MTDNQIKRRKNHWNWCTLIHFVESLPVRALNGPLRSLKCIQECPNIEIVLNWYPVKTLNSSTGPNRWDNLMIQVYDDNAIASLKNCCKLTCNILSVYLFSRGRKESLEGKVNTIQRCCCASSPASCVNRTRRAIGGGGGPYLKKVLSSVSVALSGRRIVLSSQSSRDLILGNIVEKNRFLVSLSTLRLRIWLKLD